MIQVNDLRVGNIIEQYVKYVIVDGIDKKHRKDNNYYIRVKEDKEVGYWSNQFKPIKLTEEILLKIKGIEKTEFCHYTLPNGLIIASLFSEFSIRKIIDSENTIFICEIEFLHELQNIYYWLNDKQELEINL